eukprot:COSAG02_NODE_7625_length_2927_cov_14.997171_4_plen_108_part_00
MKGLVRNQESAATFSDWDDNANMYDNPVAGEDGEQAQDRQEASSTFEDEQDHKSAADTDVFDMDNPARNVRMFNFYEILCALANGLPFRHLGALSADYLDSLVTFSI